MQAAKSGAEATIKMKAKAGRASYVNIAQHTQRDPGAEAVAACVARTEPSMKNSMVLYSLIQ